MLEAGGGVEILRELVRVRGAVKGEIKGGSGVARFNYDTDRNHPPGSAEGVWLLPPL